MTIQIIDDDGTPPCTTIDEREIAPDVTKLPAFGEALTEGSRTRRPCHCCDRDW